MERTPKQVVESILANLEGAREVARAKVIGAGSHCNELLMAREAYTYQQSINLIKTESAAILNEQPVAVEAPEQATRRLRAHDIDTVERFLALIRINTAHRQWRHGELEHHHTAVSVYAKAVLRAIVEGGYLP